MLLCSFGAAFAAQQPWTVDDLLNQESLGTAALSTDGKLAAYTVSRWEADKEDKGKKRRAHQLYLVDLESGAAASDDVTATKLTHGGERIGSIAFSPDGMSLAFTSDRDVPGPTKTKGSQLWLLPLSGGEARPLTRFSRGVQSFDWVDDDSLLVARAESASGLERRRKGLGDTTRSVDDPLDSPPVRLWRVPLDGRPERLTLNDDWIQQLDVDPAGKRAVIYASNSLSYVFDSKVPPTAWIVDLETGERTAIDLAGSRSAGGFRWSPDGGSVWFSQNHSTHPIYRSATIARPVRWDAASGRAEVLDTGWSRGLGGSPMPVSGGALAVFDDGVFARPVLIPETGGHRPLDGEAAGEDLRYGHRILAASDDGRSVLWVMSASDRPTQLYAARLDTARTGVEAMQQLTKLNESFESKPMPRVEVLHFQGAEGDQVEGLLHYPVGWQDGDAPAPLVLAPHGGPASHDRHAWDFRWSYPNLLLQQRGAFVLEVNYHGSDGYGIAWAESIETRYYELEIPDLEAGVDHVIERGLADPERLAVAGWSNGGILAAKLITVTDRYRAAIIGAADVEWVSDWANVDFGGSFDNYYFGGPPWERLDHYLEKSPFFQLPEVTTPALVHTGTEDRAVPPHQSWSIFRVMQQVEKTDVKLLLYPGEGHGLRKLGHQRRKVEEDMAWMDRYLFATQDEGSAAFERVVPEDSLLAAKLARGEAATSNGVFGRLADGVLVPELVPLKVGDTFLDVGRFEVTRAQWAAFDSDYAIAPGTDDHPITGLSLEEAKGYVEWLAARLGRELRLPTTAEADKMAGSGGNTLDRWLGHKANPDDATSIRRTLSQRGISLLESVGSGSPRRDHDAAAAVFDLDGNAAEWATDDDGGRAVGPSADRSSNEALFEGGEGHEANEPQTDYVGLRVVAEPAV